MYHPILRAKQFEQIALREIAPLVDPSLVCPVIEPVRDNLQLLIKTIQELNRFSMVPIVIINPLVGDFMGANPVVVYDGLLKGDIRFTACVDATNADLSLIKHYHQQLQGNLCVYLNGSVSNDVFTFLVSNPLKILARGIGERLLNQLNNLVLIEDGFKRQQRNSDYPKFSVFGDLHAEFQFKRNVIGFGDYTIVGDAYSESGGPAFVIAIHLSYIDADEFDTMFVRHFISYNDNSQFGPGEKFIDALGQLLHFAESSEHVYQSNALEQYKGLYSRQHYPGLGVVKKLAIQHHIETLIDYLREVRNV